MKVLIIGSGGREHAIAYKLNESPQVTQIYAWPGNPGIGEIGICIEDGNVEDQVGILEFAENNQIDLVVIGPEVPLCEGLADTLEENDIHVFGVSKQSAMLEGSKAFSKQFMERHHIPTAKYVEVTDLNEALEKVKTFSLPVVIKADGLAAGKGVVICQDYEEANQTLTDFLSGKVLAGAGKKVIIEEFLDGYECSLLCFVDGETILPMVSSKDHKQIYENNQGPNTGGMGTISPNPFLKPEIEATFYETILKPFMDGLKKDQMDFRGVIFIGLMIQDNKAKVLEFNVRFGDPETQSILLRLETDLFEVMMKTATKQLKDITLSWSNDVSGCVVVASGGYPGEYEKGLPITINKQEDIIVFHAGTKLVKNQLVTNGGRVLNICAKGKTLEEVREKIYHYIENNISFDKMYVRKDIGLH